MNDKKLNWDNPGLPEAEALFHSDRGAYIVGQALHKAIEIMELKEYPEYSNINDMKLIKEHLFPVFLHFVKIKKECDTAWEKAKAEGRLTPLTTSDGEIVGYGLGDHRLTN